MRTCRRWPSASLTGFRGPAGSTTMSHRDSVALLRKSRDTQIFPSATDPEKLSVHLSNQVASRPQMLCTAPRSFLQALKQYIYFFRDIGNDMTVELPDVIGPTTASHIRNNLQCCRKARLLKCYKHCCRMAASSVLMGGICFRTLTFSSRTSSSFSDAGGSMATRVSNCSM